LFQFGGAWLGTSGRGLAWRGSAWRGSVTQDKTSLGAVTQDKVFNWSSNQFFSLLQNVEGESKDENGNMQSSFD
jgi:hypothetical protein